MSTTPSKQVPSSNDHPLFCFRKTDNNNNAISPKVVAIVKEDLAKFTEQRASDESRTMRRLSASHPYVIVWLNPMTLAENRNEAIEQIANLFNFNGKTTIGIAAIQIQKILGKDPQKADLILEALQKVYEKAAASPDQKEKFFAELVEVAAWKSSAGIVANFWQLYPAERQSLTVMLFERFKKKRMLKEACAAFLLGDGKLSDSKKISNDFLRNGHLTTEFARLIIQDLLGDKLKPIAEGLKIKKLKISKQAEKIVVDPASAKEQIAKIFEILGKSTELHSLFKECAITLKELFPNEDDFNKAMHSILINFILLRGINPFFTQHSNEIELMQMYASFSKLLQDCASYNKPYPTLKTMQALPQNSREHISPDENTYRQELNQLLLDFQPRFATLFEKLSATNGKSH